MRRKRKICCTWKWFFHYILIESQGYIKKATMFFRLENILTIQSQIFWNINAICKIILKLKNIPFFQIPATSSHSNTGSQTQVRLGKTPNVVLISTKSNHTTVNSYKRWLPNIQTVSRAKLSVNHLKLRIIWNTVVDLTSDIRISLRSILTEWGQERRGGEEERGGGNYLVRVSPT